MSPPSFVDETSGTEAQSHLSDIHDSHHGFPIPSLGVEQTGLTKLDIPALAGNYFPSTWDKASMCYPSPGALNALSLSPDKDRIVIAGREGITHLFVFFFGAILSCAGLSCFVPVSKWVPFFEASIQETLINFV
jgi:hypothetical protein